MPSLHLRHHHADRERGASAVEYALVLVGIAALIVLAVVGLGGKTTGMFDHTCDTIDTQPSASCQS